MLERDALDGERRDARDDEADRLITSWAVAPPNSYQSRYAAATPTLAAAGIVVTEIRTPIRAPDLAVVRESIPATPGEQRDHHGVECPGGR